MNATYITAFSKTLANLRVEDVPDPTVIPSLVEYFVWKYSPRHLSRPVRPQRRLRGFRC
jgi:hypothetical protein